MKFIIEPLILPLVDALNETGLLETFSSCQGHFGEEEEPDTLNDRTKADVRAYLRDGASEKDVEELILHVLSDHMDDSMKWGAVLSISKQYIADPREEGVLQPLDYYFLFTLQPFDRGAPDTEKRQVVSTLIAETTSSVKQHTKTRQQKS